MKLSKKVKSELFNILLKEYNFFNYAENNDLILNLLNDIWNLRSMPSEDPRFENAYDDILQHIIYNQDWSFNHLFLERLKLLQEDIVFNKFLEIIVESKYRENEDEIMKFVLIINSYIESEKVSLSIAEYDENEQPVYLIQKLEDKETFIDIAPNKIPFYVEKEPEGYCNLFPSHTEPIVKPAFILAHNSGWNDYGSWTVFSLFLYKTKDEKVYIGETKITNGIDKLTASVLPPSPFLLLPDSFCSLGQNFSFYKKLKDSTGKLFNSILFALKDVAFFPDIHDKFEKKAIFKNSLLREDEAERQLR